MGGDAGAAAFDQILQFDDQDVLVVAFQDVENRGLVVFILTQQQADAEFQDWVSHFDVLSQIVDNEWAQEFGTTTFTQEILSLVDIFPLLACNFPVLNVFPEHFGSLPLNVIGQQFHNHQFVLRLEEVGIFFVHFHNGLNHIRISHNQACVLLLAQSVQFCEDFVKLGLCLLISEFGEFLIDLNEFDKFFATTVDSCVLEFIVLESFVFYFESVGHRGREVSW